MATQDLITLQLTTKELDYVANCLGQRPYFEVVSLFTKLQQQVVTQQAKPPDPVKPEVH